MTDSRFESCISLIRQGNSEGLREIYENYFKLIFSVMLSVVKNRADAEDLTSDFFVKLWDKLADCYKSGSGHKSWLVTSARNLALDWLRKHKRVELTLDDDTDDSPHNEPQSGENPEEDVLGTLSMNDALQSLETKEREILNLKLFAEMTFKEIAKALEMPMGTVTWKYRRAILKLKKYYEEVQGIE